MLTKLEAYSAWEQAPLLPLSEFGVETDFIQIRNIEGLGPVEASVNTAPLGSMDGESFTGSVVGKRNIVITAVLNPDWATFDMAELRRLYYRYFMTKMPVRLVFYNDDLEPVEITGFVETSEPNIFSKDGEIVTSILCPDPYFTAVSPTVHNGLSSIDGSNGTDITYLGNIETGFHVKVNALSGPTPTSIAIQIREALDSYFRVAASVTETKYFEAHSVSGEKYVQNVDLGTGIITNLLSKVESGSKWPTIQPGVNEFSVITNSGSQDWELSYHARYGGL